MAGLKKVLTGNKSLALTSEEELQNLSSKKGRVLPPSSPVESGQLGATPDQAKMTGSKANLQSTLKQAAQPAEAPTSAAAPAQSLQQALAYRQARTDKTSAEQFQTDLAATVAANSNHLIAAAGTAAQQAITTAVKGGTQGLKLQIPGVETLGLTPEETAALTHVLDPAAKPTAADLNLLSKSTSPVIKKIVNLDTFKGGGTGAVDAINLALGEFGAQVGSASAGAIADTVSIKELYSSEEWVDIEAELMNTYGVTKEDLDGTDTKPPLTVQELQAKIDEKIQSDFQETESLMDIMNDPSATPATRAEAARQLRDAGALDIAALEMDDMVTLAMEVADADNVEIGGKTYTIAELLGNENISAMVSAYVNGKAGDATYDAALTELTALGMTAWVDANKKSLTDAATTLGTNIQSIVDEQVKNTTNANQAAGLGIDAATIASRYGTDSFVDTATSLGINAFMISNPTEAATLSGIGPELGGQILDLSAEELRQLTLDGNNKTELTQLKQAKKELPELNYASSPNSFLENFEAMISDAVKMSHVNDFSGKGGTPELLKQLDKDGDGNLDDDWKQTLQGTMVGSLKDILNSDLKVTTKDSLSKLLREVSSRTGLHPWDYDANGHITQEAIDGNNSQTLENLYKDAPGTFFGHQKNNLKKKILAEQGPAFFNGKGSYDELFSDITGSGTPQEKTDKARDHSHAIQEAFDSETSPIRKEVLRGVLDRVNKVYSDLNYQVELGRQKEEKIVSDYYQQYEDLTTPKESHRDQQQRRYKEERNKRNQRGGY